MAASAPSSPRIGSRTNSPRVYRSFRVSSLSLLVSAKLSSVDILLYWYQYLQHEYKSEVQQNEHNLG